MHGPVTISGLWNTQIVYGLRTEFVQVKPTNGMASYGPKRILDDTGLDENRLIILEPKYFKCVPYMVQCTSTPLTLCRRQIDSGGNLLCNINNMAQIRLNTTERDVDLPRRANLRLKYGLLLPKMLADALKI